MKRLILSLLTLCTLSGLMVASWDVGAAPPPGDPSPPSETVKLIFVHHSTGGNWLADPNQDQPSGGLGRALMENNYYVSATNYGWGPDGIGDRTDIPNWPEWFTGPGSDTYLDALYAETGQNVGDFGAWSRLSADPGGENAIVMFKSCFPNSDLYGNPDDPPYPEPSGDEYSVSNAKAVYNEILGYFETRQDKLFIVVTAPPLMESETAPQRAANARAFNDWLVNEWLQDYPYPNVAVFDYYNVLTSNGDSPDVNDAGSAGGNHHRWWDGAVQHVQTVDNNFSSYPSGDSHPSTAGHQKATEEFVPLLNVYYHRWQSGGMLPSPAPQEEPTAPPASAEPTTPPEEPTAPPPEPTTPPEEPAPPLMAPGVIDDFEAGTDLWSADIGEGSDVACEADGEMAQGGARAMRIRYDVAAQSWVGCGRYFDAPQDWSDEAGISFWLRAEPAGQRVTLALFSGDMDSPTPFEAHLEVAGEWTPFSFAWTDLAKAEWVGDEGLPELDPARVTGLGFSLAAEDGSREGTLWLDEIGFASVQTPPPTEAPPEAPAEPTDTVAVTIAAEPTTPAEPDAIAEPTTTVEPGAPPAEEEPVKEESSDASGPPIILLAVGVLAVLAVGGMVVFVMRRR